MTQIVRANEADFFHNRLSHTLKVAQVGRRMAETLTDKFRTEAELIGLNADVVAAASLIHDLGHPPFGHIGENELDKLVRAQKDEDGFEGNAQSFRIVTKLSVRFEEAPGLDLTRAVLRGSLKYPWHRVPGDPDKGEKFGAYLMEKADFDFALEGLSTLGQSAEAALMDWADDIAYSIHDMEDMHRARLIPWNAVMSDAGREVLIEKAVGRWHKPPSDAAGRLREAHSRVKALIEFFVPGILSEPYNGEKEHRREIRFLTSRLIARCIDSTSLSTKVENGILIKDDMADEVRLLKQLARSYIIGNPSLAAQQHGQRKVISDLFSDIMSSSGDKIIPIRFKYIFDDNDISRARATADLISSLTESEAMAFHKRLRGTEAGSVLDPIVW